MLLRNQKIGWIVVALLVGLGAGCKPARYEIVTNTKGGEPVKPVVEPNPTPDDNKNPPTDQPTNQPPALPPGQDRPFRVEGPATGKVGQIIKVVGIDCGPNNSGKITFIALGTTIPAKSGPSADFTFDRANTYTIEGTCEQDGKAPQKATLSVKIEDAAPATPGGGQNQSGQNQSSQSL